MIQKSEINHAILFYHELCRLRTLSGSENSVFSELVEDFSYVLMGESNIFSDNTIANFIKLKELLLKYNNTNTISFITTIKLIDKEYLEILDKPLDCVINSIESDFHRLNINFDKCKSKFVERPTDEEILENIKLVIKSKA